MTRARCRRRTKAYVQTNEHDVADAEAGCGAVRRPGMRFVPVKTEAQQATPMLHRVRDQLIGQRPASLNALRGHPAELGIVAAQRRVGLRQLLALLGELADERIPPLARDMLQLLVAQIREFEDKIAGLDRRLVALTRTDPVCRALAEVPGVGPVSATAFAAPDANVFRSGRHLAAWLGLVPRQHATAGKERRLGIGKRGDGYLRRRLIHGARAVVKVSPGRTGKLWSDCRPAGTPTVARRGRGGRPQAGADSPGDAQPRRASSGGLSPLTPRGPFPELRGQRSDHGRIGRTEAGTTRDGPRASRSFA